MDYPAAHSTDTLWFAADADGHVAVFDTGPEGPLPVGVDRDHVTRELPLAYGRELARGFAAGELDDERAIDGNPDTHGLLLVLDEARPEPWPGYLESESEQVSEAPLTLLVRDPSRFAGEVAELRASAALRASFTVPWVIDDRMAARLGLYHYRYGAAGGPDEYARVGAGPERPRVVGTMPWAQVFALPRTRFARDVTVTVTAQLPCEHYNGYRSTPDGGLEPPPRRRWP